MPEKAASSPALQTLGVWVVTGLASAKACSMKSVGFILTQMATVCLKLCCLKDMI